MYCMKCGKELPDDAKFCLECGAKVPVEKEDVPAEFPEEKKTEKSTAAVVPVERAAEEREERKPEHEGTPSDTLVMVLGIVSIALASYGIPGIILSLITMSKVRAREAVVGILHGKAKVGRILSRVALPVSIAVTALIILYILIYILFVVSLIVLSKRS